MNIDKKTCINMGIVVFLLYLAIHYWDGLVGLFNLFLAAAGTLINGAIIAYVLKSSCASTSAIWRQTQRRRCGMPCAARSAWRWRS
ncbi:MAG: hypothetical protein ACLT1X_00695 [Christensenellales bacterium]